VIHLNRLRLTGPRRHYDVDFDARDDNVAIIAGPIHTGKTTILQLVDYLLGDDEHPTHPELARSVRSAALELTISGERWTIERPLFSVEQVAYLRPGGLDDDGPLQRKTIDPPGEADALSEWLLDRVGLPGLRLRVTEGNPNSSAHVLSFRDLMWLAFLPSKRLDNEALLHEGHDQKHYKLRQVIEVLFDVHDDRLAQLLDQQKRIRDERRDAQQEVANLETFLAEEELPALEAARARQHAVSAQVAELDTEIVAISRRAAASTEFANALRSQYAAARAASARGAARLRDRESLLERLMPLRGQYAEDQRKLAFYSEARRLFDPLHIQHCPACLERLAAPPAIRDGHCTVCGQVPSADPEPGLDRKQERRALTARIHDLDAYTQQVSDQLRDARVVLTKLQQHESQLGADLDARTASQLSPFVAEREQMLRDRARLYSEQTDLRRTLRWYDALERRKAHVAQLTARLADLREQLEALRNDQPDRRAVIGELSDRFAALLVGWGFPKVDDPEMPFLDEKFIPHVRGRGYRGIGSDGALTLIALAWMLAIFEMAIERGAPHPGFLMIDSPQKNLAPKTGQTVDEYMDPAIVERFYEHVRDWAGDHPQAQLVIVDHEPVPRSKDQVVVRYTRRADIRPYGLIDDQTDETMAR
jgi:hypothetical protein